MRFLSWLGGYHHPVGVRQSAVSLVLASILISFPATAEEVKFIDIGAAPFLGAYDQPFVEIEIHNGPKIFGPAVESRTFLLDTGATSILAVGGAAGELQDSPGSFNEGEFLEQGVGGFIPYQVSAPYTTTISGRGDSISVDNVRILTDPFTDFGEGVGFEGIVGMPALVNRVTTLDMQSSTGGLLGGVSEEDIFDLDRLIDSLATNSSGIGVSFSESMPKSNGHRYGIPTRALHFDSSELPPIPTQAPLPIVSASHHRAGQSSSGDNYIVDTGAQISFMSLERAREAGLDPENPFTTLEITGVGGQIEVPVFYLEELRMMSLEGVELVWTDVQVIGLDLHPSIDGVIGSDLLTTGLVEVDLEAVDFDDLIKVGTGPIEKVHLDFRDLEQPDHLGEGVMYFDLNPDFDVIQTERIPLQAGDANQDYEFDQADVVQVMQSGKYLTDEIVGWEDGDWDGAPGGRAGHPPVGDGFFNQKDIVAALRSGLYKAGPYAAIQAGGVADDDQTSIRYDSATGELSVDAPAGIELTSINIESGSSVFTGAPAENLGGSFDNDTDSNIFKATFGGSFGSISFGNVAQVGLSEDDLLNDLTIDGSLAGGGALGAVDLIYVAVPEPASAWLMLVGAAIVTCRRQRRRSFT